MLLVAQFVLTFSGVGAAFHIFTFFGAKWTATTTTRDWKHLLKRELEGTENTQGALVRVLVACN